MLMSERCRHDSRPGECGYCAEIPADLPSHVYITPGGAAWHVRLECHSLTEGQAWVEARDGHPGEPVLVTIKRARDMERHACGDCAA